MANRANGRHATHRTLTRRSFLRRGTYGLAAAGTGVLLAGCGGESEGGSGGQGGPRKATFLCVTPLSLGFSAELIADTAGYFADEGVEIEFQFPRGSAQAIQVLLAGGAPLTRIGDIEAMIAIAGQDAPLVNVAMPVKLSTLRIVSSSENPLEKPEDFRGNLIGVPSEGGTSETTLDLVLAAGGIDKAEVPRQVVGLTPGVFSLVREGRIAGYFVSTDTAIQIQHQHPDAVVFEPGTVIATGGQFYAVSREGLERDRDLLRGYLRAIRTAADFIIADEELDETLELIRSTYDFETLRDTEIAKESLRSEFAAWTVGGNDNVLAVVPERWNAAYEELVAAGLIQGGLDPNEWYTNELVEG